MEGKKGQVESVQLAVTVRTSPVKYDTDGDNLNDSEELSLGSDGFLTDPWKTDTDGDGLADNEYATKGTSPVLADTDRDGYNDRLDLVPLGDAFVEVSIDSTYVFGSDPHNPGDTPYPFVKASILGNDTYTYYLSRYGNWIYPVPDCEGDCYYEGHRLSVNVPDDVSRVLITIEMWSYDSRGNNEHLPVGVARDTSFGGCSDVNKTTIQYNLQAPGQSTPYQPSGGCASSPRYAYPLNITATTKVPDRLNAYLLVPRDYTGIYNVTDAYGDVVSQRYVGEPRFVALVLNVSQYDLGQGCYCGPGIPATVLAPRSVFFETRLYSYLNDSNPISPLGKLAFRQNSTTASSNSDDIHQILAGNVTLPDWNAIWEFLSFNETGAWVRETVNLGNSLLLFTLPDGAIRLAGYTPPLTSPSYAYTFCASGCNPPPRPWWELVWAGIVSTVISVVTSALVFAATAFANLVEVLAQIGAWVWNNIVGPGIEIVASAVEAAAEALEQLASWVETYILDILRDRFETNFSALRELMMEYASSSAAGVLLGQSEMRASGSVSDSASAQFANAVFLSPFALLSLVLSVAVTVALIVITNVLLAFPFVIPVVPFLVSSLFALAFSDQVPSPTFVAGLPLALDFDAIATVSEALTSGGATAEEAAERAELVEVIAFLLKAAAVLVGFFALFYVLGDAPFVGLLFGIFSMALAAAAIFGQTNDWPKPTVRSLAVSAIVLGLVGMVVDVIGLPAEFAEGNVGGIIATVSALVLSAMAITLSLVALNNL